ncbi:MAG: alpha/beta hydrolase [Treponema sp.]|nr:alpha/beta hydrolase [Treponema sp.]
MAMENNRKGAIKKLKLLTYNTKTNIEVFRNKMDTAFYSPFLPNGVERTEYKYGGIDCDVLAPEIYSSNRILIYIHGGCFAGGSRQTYRAFCSSLAAKCYSRVVVPEFRLSPAYPYPAAITDVQSVFRAVFTEEQITASLNSENNKKSSMPEIVIAADGSGASIASALLFNLRDRYRACIKQVVFFSPWLDISENSRVMTVKKINDEVLNADIFKKSSSDYTFVSNTNISAVSPMAASDEELQNFPPLFIQMGSKELLLDDAKSFTERMQKLGNECHLDIWQDMMFMFQMVPEYLHESHLALDRVGKIVTGDVAGKETIEIENKPKLEHSLKSEA